MFSATPAFTRAPEFDLILHVVEASLGGLRRHVADLITGIAVLGVRQALAYAPGRADTGMRRLVAWCRDNGVDTHEIEMVRPLSPVTDARAVVRLHALMRDLRPEVVHLHSSKAGGVGRLAALLHRRARVVYTPNGLAAHLSPAYGLIEAILGRLRTDALIAVSKSEFDEIRARGTVPEGRLVRVDSGIDLQEPLALAAREPATPESGVVFVGRLSAQKDPLFAADVSATVLRNVPEARFTWVGDGELRSAFEDRLEQLGVRDRWSITGWMENPYPIVAAARVCALASRYESFGYVTLEAMALGKPMVATRVAGSIDLVDSGVTGFLVALDSMPAFAEAIVRLLRDTPLREAMGAAARQRAELFSRDRMARETLEAYSAGSFKLHP